MISSQEVDITQISNSLDNDFPSLVDPLSVNEAISTPPKTISTFKVANSSSSSGNKCPVSKFKKEWLSNSNFSTFLGEKLVQFVFPIPASNVFCESIFSHMKYLWDNNRNRMKHDLVRTELKIKISTHYTCTQLYDYLLNKLDLLKQIRSSDKYSHIAKVPRIV
jgi:hypothetical protein